MATKSYLAFVLTLALAGCEIKEGPIDGSIFDRDSDTSTDGGRADAGDSGGGDASGGDGGDGGDSGPQECMPLEAPADPCAGVTAMGQLDINSGPPGAYVWIDNVKHVRQTPSGAETLIVDVKACPHIVTMALPGSEQDQYKLYHREITVPMGETVAALANFSGDAMLARGDTDAQFGKLQIEGAQPGAKLFVDGTDTTFTVNAQGVLSTAYDIIEGAHMIELVNGGSPVFAEVLEFPQDVTTLVCAR
jgi:hypothetical protein